MDMKRRLIVLFLCAALALSFTPATAAADAPSDWAVNAVNWLRGTGKLTDADFTGYDRVVTRLDFARLAVVLYELITGMPTPDPADVKNPFTDTDDLNALRAYKIKVVNGTGAGTLFSPGAQVSREQIAVMLLRVLDTCGVTYSQADVSGITFSDEADLGWWAVDGVKRAYLIQVMNGTGGTSMSPKAPVTMEQAYQLLYNVYTNRDAIRAGAVRSISSGAAGTISLKYTGGGKYDTGWCEDAYHGQPVVCDVDQDGSLDILAASYTVQCLDAATGSLKWRFPAGKDRNTVTDGASPSQLRTWPGLYVGDIDGDGHNEIVAGHGSSLLHQGVLAVYDENGYFKPGWPQSLPNEVYSVAVADLDGDGTMEIAAGIGVSDGLSVYVYEHDGSLRPGWPQLDAAHDGRKTYAAETDPNAPSIAYSYGIFNDNLAIGDIDGDGVKEIVAPADMGQICAYKPNGSQVRTALSLEFGSQYGVTDKAVWGRVGAFSDAGYESSVHNGGFGREYGPDPADPSGEWLKLDLTSLPMNERLTAHFTHSKAVVADLDGNGSNEVAVVGDVHDRADEGKTPLPHLYHELFIFNGDRTRFNAAWAVQPIVKEAPLCPLTDSDWETMDRCMPDPVCADLDGDGRLEILYPDFSGKLNCYWLDHTQHGSWPINVYDGSTMEYASAPTVCDLNGDGKPEVVFTTYTQKTGSKKGSLCIADADGKLLQQVELPDASDTSNPVPNGCMAAPVVCDMDGDGKLEIVLQTYLSGITVYDLA